MSLIKNIDEVKKYLSVDISMNTKTITPYLQPAEEHIIRLLGKDQFQELDDYFIYGESTIEELDALLPYVQRPIVNFAFFLGLSMLNVTIGDSGIAVVSNSNLTPASKQRTDDLKADLEKAAYDSLETLLEFLEEHTDDYPLWEASDAYAYQYEFLITSARRFDELLRIDRSRLTFLNWRPTMADVEFLEIHPAVSKEFCDELKEESKSGTVSEANQVVLPLLQKALAYLTAAIEIDKKYEIKAGRVAEATHAASPHLERDMAYRKSFMQLNNKYENRGRQYLMEAKRIMDASPDTYPTYRDSSVYVSTLTSYQRYENAEDSNFFVTG